MRLLKAIGGFFAAILNIITFGVLDLRKWMISSSTGIKAEYTAIIDEKRKRANSIKDAVGSLVANNEKRKARLEVISKDCQNLRQKQNGALNKLKARMAEVGEEGSKTDTEVARLRAAYKDFGSTLKEKEQHADELEVEIGSGEEQIANFEIQVKSLARELEKLQDEKSLTVAEIQAAKEAKAAADQLSGLADDTTTDRLNDLREMRMKAKADVKVAERISGLDNAKDDEEFLAASSDSELDDELDKLLGIASGAEHIATTEEPVKVTAELPE